MRQHGEKVEAPRRVDFDRSYPLQIRPESTVNASARLVEEENRQSPVPVPTGPDRRSGKDGKAAF
ncbi:MAG: hypothetical protein OXG99_06955, partial [Alphaproteobacteria bacterium]|nr:hypothetical protein [Alphaproteobacteria bacterium]